MLGLDLDKKAKGKKNKKIILLIEI